MQNTEILHIFNNQLREASSLSELKVSSGKNSYFRDEKDEITGLHLNGDLCTDQFLSVLPQLHLLKVLRLSEYPKRTIRIPEELKELEYLNLSYNKNLEEINFDRGLPNLTELHLDDCQLKILLLPVGFEKLMTVYANSNQLTVFVLGGESSNLNHLYLADNRINDLRLPSYLPEMKSLFLNGGNKIEDIRFLANSPHLNTVNLSQNQVSDLSPLWPAIENGINIRSKSRGDGILVEGCPLISPPPEIVEQGREALLNYFQEIQEEGTGQIREVKMLILGEGGAGKTSLVIRIREGMNAQLPGVGDSTKGIDIKQYTFQTGPDDEFQINIWDFGGQEIYHSTHQFFLTKRSVYILVTDERKEDHNFDYWLDLIRLLSDNSPVVVVQNMKGGRFKDLNRSSLRGRFENIKDFFHFDLNDNAEELQRLKREIEHQVQQLPHVKEVLPKVWVDIRRQINAIKQQVQPKPKYYIHATEYYDLCEEADLDEDRADFLSQYLHDLGVFLHFQEDPILKHYVFLNNEWVTEGVYAILDNEAIQQNGGRFSRQEAAGIWTGRFRRMHDELLRLMTKFELCYRIPGLLESQEVYIAPQLLPANEPGLAWDYSNNLQLRYHYEFMPKGILSRLIVRLHRYIQEDKKEAWKSGVVLHRQGAKARVVEDYPRRNIQIHASGTNARALITLIAEEIDLINSGYYNLNFKKRVPCNCKKCVGSKEPYFYDHAHLLNRIENNKLIKECDNSFEDVNVLELLDNIFTKRHLQKPGRFDDVPIAKGPKKVFISYSRKDDDHLQNLKKQLSPLLRQNQLVAWDDTQLKPGEEWDERIREELRAADIVIFLITANFLATDYIWDIEMKTTLERQKNGEALIFSVVASDCLWEQTPFARFTLLPTKGKPVTFWDKTDEAWALVARKLSETIKEN